MLKLKLMKENSQTTLSSRRNSHLNSNTNDTPNLKTPYRLMFQKPITYKKLRNVSKGWIEALNIDNSRHTHRKNRYQTIQMEQPIQAKRRFRRQSCWCDQCGIMTKKQREVAVTHPVTVLQSVWHLQLMEIILRKIAQQRNVKGKLKIKNSSSFRVRKTDSNEETNQQIMLPPDPLQKLRKLSLDHKSKFKPQTMIIHQEQQESSKIPSELITSQPKIMQLDQELVDKIKAQFQGTKYKIQIGSKDDYSFKYKSYEFTKFKQRNSEPKSRRLTERFKNSPSPISQDVQYSSRRSRPSFTSINLMFKPDEVLIQPSKSSRKILQIKTSRSPKVGASPHHNKSPILLRTMQQHNTHSPFLNGNSSPANVPKRQYGSMHNPNQFGTILYKRHTIITRLARGELSVCESDSLSRNSSLNNSPKENLNSRKSMNNEFFHWNIMKKASALIRQKTSQTIFRYVNQKAQASPVNLPKVLLSPNRGQPSQSQHTRAVLTPAKSRIKQETQTTIAPATPCQSLHRVYHDGLSDQLKTLIKRKIQK